MSRRFGMAMLVLAIAAGLTVAVLSQQWASAPGASGTEGNALPVAEPDKTAAKQPVERPLLRGASEAASTALRARQPAVKGREGTEFTGRVLDAAGKPAGGATVEAVASEGVVATAHANAAGTFRFRLLVTEAMTSQPGIVRARGPDGTVGLVPLYFAARGDLGAVASPKDGRVPRDVGTVWLGPPHAFDVRVASRCRTGLPATLWLVSPAMWIFTPWTKIETDGQGAARFEGVPAGSWMIVAGSPGCGRARALVQLPRETAEPVAIELPDAHVVTVKVQDAASAQPVAGALVRVSEQLQLPDHYTQGPLVSAPAAYTTDLDGVARIDSLGGGETLFLSTEAEGYPRGSEHGRGRGRGPGEVRVEPGQADVLIQLQRPVTVRWPIKNEGIGIPADGTQVAIEPWTNTGRMTVPPKGVIEGQEIVVEGWGPDGASGYAVIAGQGIAQLSAGPGETKGYPTAFYPLRRVGLVLRLPGGAPAEGWSLVVRDQGNNEVKPAVKTDAEGQASMEGLHGGPGSLVNVSVSGTGGWGGFAMPLGSVDLSKGDGHFEAEIPPERTLRIRLTVAGRAMPADFPGRPMLNHRAIPPTEAEGTVDDPGLFVVTWRPIKPDGQAYVSGQAAGYLAETKTVSLANVSATDEVVIDLRLAGSLRVKATEPADKRYRIAIDRWNVEQGTWNTPGLPQGFNSGRGQRADANGLVVFQNLEPGRYRAVDTLSGLTSDAIDVPAGGEPAELAFDVSTTGWVTGRAVVPEGFSWNGVNVGEVDAKADIHNVFLRGTAALPGTHVNPKDGTFWFRAPGTRPLTLRLYHATLRPHPTKGLITVTKASEGLELHAVRGATATVRFATPAPVTMNRGQPQQISVRLYPGPVEGPGSRLVGVLDGPHTSVEFGGFEPGTYTVWIDAPGSAPVVLKDVALGVTDADLGTVELSVGATFEVQVTVKAGQSPPRCSVWLQKLDEPTYTRNTDAAGETIVVKGIGPGRFSVSVSSYDGAAPGIQEEIEFDGQTKVVRRIDRR